MGWYNKRKEPLHHSPSSYIQRIDDGRFWACRNHPCPFTPLPISKLCLTVNRKFSWGIGKVAGDALPWVNMSTQKASDWEGECVGPLGLMFSDIPGGIDSYLATSTGTPIDVNEGCVFPNTRGVEKACD